MDKNNYYDPRDLKKFGKIREYQKPLGDKFFEYYNAVLEEGALTKREKSLIGLAVAHVIQCPYCVEAYTVNSLENGADETQMMEAIHVGAAVRGGAALVHGVQMMEKVDQLSI